MFQQMESNIPGLPDFTAQVRRITLSERSLLPVSPLDKGNEDSGNEIGKHKKKERFPFLVLASRRFAHARAVFMLALRFTSYR